MRLVTFRANDRERDLVGVWYREQEAIVPMDAWGLPYASMQELIENITAKERELLGQEVPIKGQKYGRDAVTLLAPIPHPAQDIICLGVNYREHAREAAEFQKDAFDLQAEYPVYFSKRVNRATAPEEEIPSYEGLVDSLDYEVELAVIIGKDARNVPKGSSLDYIFGYTILNDMSARNLQTRHKQWYFGKSLDGFAPMGPCIVTADEIPYPPCLDIKSYVNGQQRQSSNTKYFITDIDQVIHELSEGMTLKAGTIISMGTPEGVGMGFTPPRFLHPSDTVTCTIEGIGTLENQISGSKKEKKQ